MQTILDFVANAIVTVVTLAYYLLILAALLWVVKFLWTLV